MTNDVSLKGSQQKSNSSAADFSRRIDDMERQLKAMAQSRTERRIFSTGVYLVLTMFFLLLLLLTVGLMEPVQNWLGKWLGVASAPPSVSGTAASSGASVSPSSPGQIGYSDFITLFLAITAGGIAYMASMMGMKRLESYDDQFNTFRQERREFERFFRRDLREDVEELVASRSKELKSQAEHLIDDRSNAANKELQETLRASEEKLQELVAKANETQANIDNRYQHFLDNKEIGRLAKEGVNVREARDLVAEASNEGSMTTVREVSRFVLANSGIDIPESIRTTGDIHDWFNLCSALGRMDEYLLGFKVAIQGLRVSGHIVENQGRFKAVEGVIPDVDLLAHALEYSMKLGQLSTAQNILQIMQHKIPLEKRGWRFYQFVSNYFDALNEEGKFQQIVQEYRKRMPQDERAWAIEIGYHESRGDNNRAFEVGQQALEKLGQSGRANSVAFRLAQMALEAGRYDEVINLTDTGFEGGAEAQPNASVGGIVFCRANAYDGLFFKEVRKEHKDPDRIRYFFERAMNLYNSDLAAFSLIYRQAAEERKALMRARMEEEGLDVGEADRQTPVDNRRAELAELGQRHFTSVMTSEDGDFSEVIASLAQEDGPTQMTIISSFEAALKSGEFEGPHAESLEKFLRDWRQRNS